MNTMPLFIFYIVFTASLFSVAGAADTPPENITAAAKKINPAQQSPAPDPVMVAAREAAEKMASFLRGNDPSRQRRDVVAVSDGKGGFSFKYINSNGVAENIVLTPEAFGSIAMKLANKGNHGAPDAAFAALARAQAIRATMDAGRAIGNIIGRDVRPKMVDGKPLIVNGEIVFEYFSASAKTWKDIDSSILKDALRGPGDTLGNRAIGIYRRDPSSVSNNSVESAIAKKNTAEEGLMKAGMAANPRAIPPEIAKKIAENIEYFAVAETMGYSRGLEREHYFNLIYDPIAKEYVGIERVRQGAHTAEHVPDWRLSEDFVPFVKEKPLVTVALPAVAHEKFAAYEDIINQKFLEPPRYEFVNPSEVETIIARGEAVAEAARRAAAQKAAAEAARPKMPEVAPKPRFKFFGR
jgi:CBS domain-containing protein